MSFLRARLREESGFSILESTVALVIIFGVLLAVVRTLDTGIRVLVETRRQAAASALGNELLERARSLEWEHTGLTVTSNDTDCPGDPPADGVAGVACTDWASEFGITTNSNGNWTFEGDEIVFANGQTFDPFLSFHEAVTRDDTTFDRYLFVTSLRTDPLDPATERWRKLTAIVQWVPPSGFRKEIRQVTYVASFREPSQPFLLGSVNFDGGSFSMSGMVQGTQDFADPFLVRPDLVSATIELPDAQVSALTDYVSGASVVAQGTIGDFLWADGFHTVGAVDGSGTCAVGSFERRADDDSASASPLDDTSTTPVTFAPWCISVAKPHDLLGDEEEDDESALDSVVVQGEAWTEHNPTSANPKVDGLPHAKLIGLDAAEAAAVFFYEYDTADIQSLYDSLGVSLSGAPYLFIPLWYGHQSGPALHYEATIDRYETSITARRVDVNPFEWDGEQVFFGRDTAYDKAIGNAREFLGWIRVDLPVVGGSLSAGEAAPNHSWSGTSGDVVISRWDPTSGPKGAYVEIQRVDYASLLGGSPITVDFDSESGDGDLTDPPFEYTLSAAGHPQLFYRVSGVFTINPPLESVSTDSNGDLAEVIMQAPSIVTGSMGYYVHDTLVGQDVYDTEFLFDLGGVHASARYINPEAP